jgi:hypothetical protein
MRPEVTEFTTANYPNLKKTAALLVTQLKYLGVTLQANIGNTEAWNKHAETKASSMEKAFYITSKRGMPWLTDNLQTNMRFYERILLKIGLYAAELWDHTPGQMKTMDKTQAQILKKIWNMQQKTPTAWVLWETGILPAAILIQLDKIALGAWRTWHQKQHLTGKPIPTQTWKQKVEEWTMATWDKQLLPPMDKSGAKQAHGIGPRNIAVENQSNTDFDTEEHYNEE